MFKERTGLLKRSIGRCKNIICIIKKGNRSEIVNPEFSAVTGITSVLEAYNMAHTIKSFRHEIDMLDIKEEQMERQVDRVLNAYSGGNGFLIQFEKGKEPKIKID